MSYVRLLPSRSLPGLLGGIRRRTSHDSRSTATVASIRHLSRARTERAAKPGRVERRATLLAHLFQDVHGAGHQVGTQALVQAPLVEALAAFGRQHVAA